MSFSYMCEYLPVYMLIGVCVDACVCMCRTEQVSARIVQEVTAEAVAVLKGEQELHPDTAVRLPSGRIRRRELWDTRS